MWPNSRRAANLAETANTRLEIRDVARDSKAAYSTSHKSLLRPEAPSFTPLGVETQTAAGRGVGGAGEGACATKAVQRAPPYEGRSTWEAYRTQFEMLVRVNNWNEMKKATYLAVSLKGPAYNSAKQYPS